MALMPDVALSFLNTRALMYKFASSASTAPLVTRPRLPESHVSGRFGRMANSSDSMNRNVESRVARARAWSSVVVAIGTPPKVSISR